MQNEQVEIIFDKDNYDAYLHEARRLVDQEIAGLLPKLANLSLCGKIGYVLQTKGKRLRPILVMLSTQSMGGRIESVKKLALAIELLHAATLIHDDVLDQDIFRRNAPTINAKWGVRDAILVGDVLASLAINLTADYGKDIIEIMSETCLLLSDGEYMDVEYAKEELLRESDYIETIRRKSASLFKAATQCGAIAANSNSDEIAALAKFGENFGLAYQIKDDLSDMTALENSIPQDINEFRATLPIIHFCENVKRDAREAFFETVDEIRSKISTEKAALLGKLQRSLKSTGSLRYCADRINQYVNSATASLKPIKESTYKAYLVQMADSLKLRYQDTV
jgi:geranylgeranyl pyrophosphate synthase